MSKVIVEPPTRDIMSLNDGTLIPINTITTIKEVRSMQRFLEYSVKIEIIVKEGQVSIPTVGQTYHVELQKFLPVLGKQDLLI